MQNCKPLPYESSCPKCNSQTASQKFCSNLDCQTWKTFGGEHFHRRCSICGFIRAERCADFEKTTDLLEVDAQLEEYNRHLELNPDFEPSSLENLD